MELSISDRVLLRRFNSSEQGKEDSQNAALFKQEDCKTVSRVDGHSPEQSLSLYDRMLLRKYPDAGTKSILSLSSSMVSSPPVAHSGGSVKKRKRFYGKGELRQSQCRSGSPERGTSRSRRLSLWISIQGCRAFCSFWTRHFTIDPGFWIIRFTFVLHTRVG